MSDDRLQSADTQRGLPKVGSLHAQWVRCGTAGCRCARGSLHGPYYAHFHRQDGRQFKRYVPKARAAVIAAELTTARARLAAVRAEKERSLSVLKAMRTTVREVVTPDV